MREFLIKEFERFLEIADTINTPFKFYENKESDVGKEYVFFKASVWLRTAYITFEKDVKENELKELVESLKRHGFTEASFRETAYPIK